MESTGKFFSSAQVRLVELVLDHIIPPKGDNPSAGELGVTSYIDNFLSETPASRRVFEEGLKQIEIESVAQHSDEFSALASEHKIGVLETVEKNSPLFFNSLVTQTYNGYYSDSRTALRLGLGSGSPQPKGHVVEPGNLDLIENVIRRGQVYRDA